MLFSVAEFPDQASITDLVENDTIKSLARSSIVYSACSSFTALSGNSDLHLHSTRQNAAVHLEMEERSIDEGKKNSENNGSSESDEEREDDETVDDESEDESAESDEEEDEEEYRDPIEHLLKVKLF